MSNKIIDVATSKNQPRVPLISLPELLSLIEFYLDPFTLEPSLAWYCFREGLLRTLREAATNQCGGVVAIPLIGEFKLSRGDLQQPSSALARSYNTVQVSFEGWTQVGETHEVPVCDLSIDRTELQSELVIRSTFWRRMPAQTQGHLSNALHSAEAVILALRYVAWYRCQAVDIPGIGVLFCDFQEKRLESLQRNSGQQFGYISFSFKFSPELSYALEEELLFQQATQM